ncbi:MAG: hypothetical protein KDA75_11420, partial [Planctomycetaceae bacterium]|nr:hypothetical protein [Planctomycetaceae bacterium]
INFEIAQVVLCANPEDRDFGRGSRTCSGRIVVADSHEDSRAQLCCPVCDRHIYPDHFAKRRIRELRSRISAEGVVQHCLDLLMEIDAGVKTLSDGVLRLDVDGREIFVCLIDFLADGIYWSKQWAELNPVCYVAVNPNHARFPDGDWLTKVSLTELVCGETQLHEVLQSVAGRGRPRDVPQASVALFGKGPAHTVIEPSRPSPPGRRFLVEVGPNIVRVDGETVVPTNAGPRFLVFRTLWQWFLDDLRAGLPPERFRAWTVDKLSEELVSQTRGGVADDGNTRKLINNLQSGIAETLKRKHGMAIGREDIVESCPNGYRINPFTVVLRPFQPDLS